MVPNLGGAGRDCQVPKPELQRYFAMTLGCWFCRNELEQNARFTEYMSKRKWQHKHNRYIYNNLYNRQLLLVCVSKADACSIFIIVIT